MSSERFFNSLRKYSRFIHRDLSFFFSGVLMIYAISGFMLNHKKDFNSDYSITQKNYQLDEKLPKDPKLIDKKMAVHLLRICKEETNYIKHYSPEANLVKIFIKGGSSLVVNLENGSAQYESIKKRPIISCFNRLHYNPSRWWTIFSDIFIISLLIIVLSGLIMLKGPKSFWGRGGIEFLIGLLIPLGFILLS